MAALVIGRKTDPAALRLAGGAALFWRLEAMVRRITDHVRERILDQIENLAIELGLGALHLQLDVLAELVGKVAHDARQLLPCIPDGLHARLHHAFLQLGRDIRQSL